MADDPRIAEIDAPIRARITAFAEWDRIAHKLAAPLVAVLTLHDATMLYHRHPTCVHCKVLWPCDTVRTIARELGMET